MVRVRSKSPLIPTNAGSNIRRLSVFILMVVVGCWLILFVSDSVVLPSTTSPTTTTTTTTTTSAANALLLRGSNGIASFLSNNNRADGMIETGYYYDSTNDAQCRFYLAESAIPQSGLGIYTTVDIATGDRTQSMADICIYVADTPKRGTHFETHSWSRDSWYGTFEGRNPRAACEGVATLFNSMPPGIQTSKLHMESTQPDHAHIVRSQHANAGAMTHYVGISSIATREVAAGSEITIDYGE
jgi:hypothetical protein